VPAARAPVSADPRALRGRRPRRDIACHGRGRRPRRRDAASGLSARPVARAQRCPDAAPRHTWS